MKILFFGDIYGRVGRKALLQELPILRQKYTPDFIIANVDNITSGRGVVEKHARAVSSAGVDILTGGDHVFDNFDEIENYITAPSSNLLRPGNFYETKNTKIWGKGHKVFEKNGKRLLVIHLLGQIFLNHNVINPFVYITEVLEQYSEEKLDGIVVDFHKEATSEIQGLSMYLDGQVSFVGGTHTHVQTNDEHILPAGTGTISDIGFNGALYSVIGADFWSVKKRFLTGLQKWKIEQSLDKNYVVSWIVIDIDESTKLCKSLEKIRIHGTLN